MWKGQKEGCQSHQQASKTYYPRPVNSIPKVADKDDEDDIANLWSSESTAEKVKTTLRQEKVTTAWDKVHLYFTS